MLQVGQLAKGGGEDTPTTQSAVTRVLIVEDDEQLTQLFQLWLQRLFDHSVETWVESTLESARSSCESLPEIDIVLLDRKLPDGDGEQFLTTLGVDSDAITVMITGVTPEPEIINLQIDDYLIKPVNEEEFMKRLSLLVKLKIQDTLKPYTDARKASLLEYHLDTPEESPLYRLFASQWAYDHLETVQIDKQNIVYELYTNDSKNTSDNEGDTDIHVSVAGTLRTDLRKLRKEGAVKLIGELVPAGDQYSWVELSNTQGRENGHRPTDVLPVYSFTCDTPEQRIDYDPDVITDRSREEIRQLLEQSYR